MGITKGPGETTHEYTFVSRDDEQELKNGEYVYYELADPDGVTGGAPRRVLGRILKRVPLQLYPDTFLAEPEIAPSEVAAMVGYDAHANELFELHVAIMGYYDSVSASFINPWIPPQSGKQIFLADDEMLTNILSRKRAGEQRIGHHRLAADTTTQRRAGRAFRERCGQHAPCHHRQHGRGQKLPCQRADRGVDAAL